MKKIATIALAFVMAMGLMTACRGNVTETTTAPTSTPATTQPTTKPTTAPTTAPTTPSTTATKPSDDGMMEDGKIDGNGVSLLGKEDELAAIGLDTTHRNAIRRKQRRQICRGNSQDQKERSEKNGKFRFHPGNGKQNQGKRHQGDEKQSQGISHRQQNVLQIRSVSYRREKKVGKKAIQRCQDGDQQGQS